MAAELIDGALRITVTGPVTGGGVARLRPALQTAAPGERLPLVLDLRGAGEIGADGLTLLSVTARALTGKGQPMTVLVADGGQPQRVIRLGGLVAHMTVLSMKVPGVTALGPPRTEEPGT